MHLEHGRKAFEILWQYQFFAKQKKCVFGRHKLEYLGQSITPKGVKVDQTKIQA